MVELPRLGMAVAGTGSEPSVASLAMLAGLTSRRCQVQHFRARACLTTTEVVRQFTGLPGRHLDAWLMPNEVCRAVFARGARHADLAIVEGAFDQTNPSLAPTHSNRPGALGPIAEALDLPTIAVVSCANDESDFHLPNLPDCVDAILLDDLADPDDFERLKHLVGLLARRPVLGAVESLPEIRRILAEVPPDCSAPEDVIAPLAASFLRFADLDAIHELARSRPFAEICGGRPCRERQGRIRVAYALDEAFGGYFSDTLETLEILGAELVDFSPLRDESLPPNIDLVMIGCGYPDRHAETLAANQCLIAALKAHVCQGRRMYSEGGGTAYLGRSMILPDRCVHGVGILPVDARLRPEWTAPTPVERVLHRDGWLGLKGTRVRGYRSGRWDLSPAEIDSHCRNCYGSLSREGDFTFHHHAVGSLIHLHLGALPEVVSAFLGPHRPSLNLPQVRFER
jgi:cobyrinic acid a,c-diamide synthase